MSKPSPSEDTRLQRRVTERFQWLVDQLGAERGFARGWKKEVADLVGISPSHLAKIMSGDRMVGLEVAKRACQRAGLPFEGFLADEEPHPADLERTKRPEWVGGVASASGELIFDRAAEMIAKFSRTRQLPGPEETRELALLWYHAPPTELASELVDSNADIRAHRGLELAGNILVFFTSIVGLDPRIFHPGQDKDGDGNEDIA